MTSVELDVRFGAHADARPVILVLVSVGVSSRRLGALCSIVRGVNSKVADSPSFVQRGDLSQGVVVALPTSYPCYSLRAFVISYSTPPLGALSS